jgi:hypoxanthine phosphoribosyltransferase
MPQGHAVEVLIPAEDVARRVAELARDVSRDYIGKRPVLVGVLKGAWVFLADLVRQLSIPVRVDFLKVSSYGGGTSSSGSVCLHLDLSAPIEGEHVLIVEDIVDTGTCVQALIDLLAPRRPASLRVCTLLDKPERRKVPVPVDYVGFCVPDRFIVGYGIDWAENFRELPFVGSITPPTGGAP